MRPGLSALVGAASFRRSNPRLLALLEVAVLNVSQTQDSTCDARKHVENCSPAFR